MSHQRLVDELLAAARAMADQPPMRTREPYYSELEAERAALRAALQRLVVVVSATDAARWGSVELALEGAKKVLAGVTP